PDLDMRDQLIDLLTRMGQKGRGPRLRNEWRLIDKPIFWGQALTVAVMIYVILRLLFGAINIQVPTIGDLWAKLPIPEITVNTNWDSIVGTDTQPHRVITPALTAHVAPNSRSVELARFFEGDVVDVLPDAAIGGWITIQLSSGRQAYVTSSSLLAIEEP
ncbi:MAG: hypothetical protein AAF556_11065, partial [Pseudomonadota bacterium]